MTEQDEKDRRIAELEAQLAAAQAPPVIMDGPAYPRLVYRAGGVKGQIDVPGNDFKMIADENEHAAASADGWQDTPVPFDPDAKVEPVAEPPAKKNGRAK